MRLVVSFVAVRGACSSGLWTARGRRSGTLAQLALRRRRCRRCGGRRRRGVHMAVVRVRVRVAGHRVMSRLVRCVHQCGSVGVGVGRRGRYGIVVVDRYVREQAGDVLVLVLVCASGRGGGRRLMRHRHALKVRDRVALIVAQHNSEFRNCTIELHTFTLQV